MPLERALAVEQHRYLQNGQLFYFDSWCRPKLTLWLGFCPFRLNLLSDLISTECAVGINFLIFASHQNYYPSYNNYRKEGRKTTMPHYYDIHPKYSWTSGWHCTYMPCYFVLGIQIRKLNDLPSEILCAINYVLAGDNDQALLYLNEAYKKKKTISKLTYYKHTAKLILGKIAYELGKFEFAQRRFKTMPFEFVDYYVLDQVANSVALCYARMKKHITSGGYFRMSCNASHLYLSSIGVQLYTEFSMKEYVSYKAMYLYRQNRRLAAMLTFKIAVDKRPIQEINILFSEAICEYNTGNYEQSFTYITWILELAHPKVLTIMHRVPSMHYYMGMMLLYCYKKVDEGLRSISLAHKLGFNYRMIRFVLGTKTQLKTLHAPFHDLTIRYQQACCA
jgi:tetratricopeptide (TPR) repeat protein